MVFTLDSILPNPQQFLFHKTSLHSLWLIVATMFLFTPLCSLPSIKRNVSLAWIQQIFWWSHHLFHLSCYLFILTFRPLGLYFYFSVCHFFSWDLLTHENESKIVCVNNFHRQKSGDKTMNEMGLRPLTIFTNYIWILFKIFVSAFL